MTETSSGMSRKESSICPRIISLPIISEIWTASLKNIPIFIGMLKAGRRLRSLPQLLKWKNPRAPTLSFEERKKVKNQIRSLEKKVQAAEADIERLGQEKDLPGASLDLETTLHNRMLEWERMSSELETLRRTYPDIN